MVVVMEIRTSPANLEASFQRLGFDSYDYSEGRGYAKGILGFFLWFFHVVCESENISFGEDDLTLF